MIQKLTDLHCYCFNSGCLWPENPHNNLFCHSCGANLLLRDRYRAIQLLGKGNSGQTFLVLDLANTSGNLCVIKQTWGEFPCYFAPEALFKLFQFIQYSPHPPTPSPTGEGEKYSPLNEWNRYDRIAKYLDQFEQNGVFYQVQEYILGDNLAKILTEKITFNTEEIWQVLTSLLPVIDYIHSCDIIHYDIKPENIISRNSLDNLVLVDIGGSKSISQGNAVYSAPEQLRGQVFFASDLYSLGVTCIHLLTGIHPFNLFDFTDNKWIWQNYWLSDTTDKENQNLAQFLDHLIAPSLEQRFSTAKEAITELKKLIVHKRLNTYNFIPPNKKKHNHKLSSWECYETLIGHQGLFANINAVAIASNDKILASGSDDKTIRIWELPTGKQCLILNGHNNFVKSVDFHPVEENILISGSSDRTIKLWDIETGDLIKTLMGHNHTINKVIFSPDGKIIASGSNDKKIILWNYETGEIITSLKGHKLGVTDIAFSPNMKLLASASTDTTIQLWDLSTFQLINIWKEHTGSVKTITFSPNGQIIATGGEDRTIRLWDVNKRECMNILSGHPWTVSCLKFSSDGEILISSSWDKTVKLWEVNTGEEIGNLEGHTDSINSVQISTNKNIIVTGSKDQTVKLWKCETACSRASALSGKGHAPEYEQIPFC